MARIGAGLRENKLIADQVNEQCLFFLDTGAEISVLHQIMQTE